MPLVVSSRHVVARSMAGFRARSLVQTLLTSRRATLPLSRSFARPVNSSFAHDAVRAGDRTPPAQAPPLNTRSRIYFAVTLAFATGIGFYISQLAVSVARSDADPAVRDLAQQQDVSGVYEYTAASFDSEVGFSELIGGVNLIRRGLACMATGHVLEVSCGTGRNLGYYDLGPEGPVDSLTLVDLSPRMVEVCRKKWDALVGGRTSKYKHGLMVRFLPASALDAMPLAPTSPAPRRYDTILQTIGLCSTPAPVALLTNMASHLNPHNPDARILLLEHGRSHLDWLNHIIDSSARRHAEIHGCWANRDIGALVAEAAAQAGLEVVRERRYHLGTLYSFELKLTPRSIPEQAPPLQPPASWRSWLPSLRWSASSS